MCARECPRRVVAVGPLPFLRSLTRDRGLAGTGEVEWEAVVNQPLPEKRFTFWQWFSMAVELSVNVSRPGAALALRIL